jgi:para-aminobenzoate synthetase/4-amino-4-deoxychorismate lyase
MPAVSNPDPGKGVFETLLVVGGRPIELDAHLARLTASLRALFGAEPGAEASAAVRDGARELALGRLRLTATPQPTGGIGLSVTGEETDPALIFPPATRAISLRSLPFPGGLGAHKWVDRALLERAEAQSPALPLLVDRDGSVLEASRANVFAVKGGVLTTPAADGRILPGVTRALAIEIARKEGAEPRQAPLTRGALLEADEVFLTSAVRGVEPVGSVDGTEIQAGGELTRLLAGELRRRWGVPD